MATLLDDFNRANENPLSGGGNWTSVVEQTDSGGLQLSSNVVAKTGSGTTWSESYWNAASFGPNTEITAKINSISASDAFGLWVRLTNPGLSTMNGYLADFDFNNGNLTLYRCVSGAFTQLAASTGISTYSAGDIIGFSAIGTTLTATRNGSTIKTLTDSTITGAGKVGLGINNHGSGTLDDFSANTIEKLIAGGNITATSTVSGTVRAQKKITPSNISATSTVSGSIGTPHLITPTTNITATSTISGGLTGVKLIVGNINAISTLSGAFVLKPGNILPANIFATSIIYEVGIIFAIIPAGYYGAFDTEDGIIP